MTNFENINLINARIDELLLANHCNTRFTQRTIAALRVRAENLKYEDARFSAQNAMWSAIQENVEFSYLPN